MNKKIESLLQKQDWPSIYEKLLLYADRKLRNLRWNFGNKISPNDMVHCAIESLLDGARSWNPDRVDILALLRGVMDSKLNHLFNSWEEKNIVSIYDFTRDDWNEENELDIKSDVSLATSPETILLERERRKIAEQILNQITGSINNDRELKIILECMFRGICKDSEIAKAAQISIERVYELRRKLKNKSKAVIG